jgi:hypothetical protein
VQVRGLTWADIGPLTDAQIWELYLLPFEEVAEPVKQPIQVLIDKLRKDGLTTDQIQEHIRAKRERLKGKRRVSNQRG